MNAAVITPATIRGRAALMDIRGMLDQLVRIDSDIEIAEGFDDAPDEIAIFGGLSISKAELLDVLARRRADVVNRLENKGICIRPDPIPVAAEAVA